jgi:hypothetical protein
VIYFEIFFIGVNRAYFSSFQALFRLLGESNYQLECNHYILPDMLRLCGSLRRIMRLEIAIGMERCAAALEGEPGNLQQSFFTHSNPLPS